MTLPKMIIFDYGHTLVYEPGFDEVAGADALLHHATRNTHSVKNDREKAIPPL